MNKKNRYPMLNIDLDAIENNAKRICDLCEEKNIRVAGVVKFSDGDKDIAGAYARGGCRQIASSRIVHLEDIKKAMPDTVTMLIRIPMLSETEEVVRWADISLNSQVETLRRLNDDAKNMGRIHSVVLMQDVGDRREGIYSREKLKEVAFAVENEMESLHLAGIGASFACMSGVLPDYENLSELAESAAEIEAVIGRKLEIVSGGSSITLTMLAAGKPLPPGINHLRIGGAIASPMGIRINRGVEIDGLSEETFLLEAEIVEVCDKPSPPEGTGKNWAGQAVAFEDKGVRTRAIAALGSQDIGSAELLVPLDPGVKVVGGSSDHTVLDVTDSGRAWKPGDAVRFRMFYMPLLYCFATRHVSKNKVLGKATKL